MLLIIILNLMPNINFLVEIENALSFCNETYLQTNEGINLKMEIIKSFTNFCCQNGNVIIILLIFIILDKSEILRIMECGDDEEALWKKLFKWIFDNETNNYDLTFTALIVILEANNTCERKYVQIILNMIKVMYINCFMCFKLSIVFM